jgi:ANTAR domain
LRRTSVDRGGEDPSPCVNQTALASSPSLHQFEVFAGRWCGLDVTHSDETREESITSVVTEIADHRAGIERAKGALMYVYRVDADAAFDLFKWRSQQTNTKLRALAEQLVSDIRTLKPDLPVPGGVRSATRPATYPRWWAELTWRRS